MSSKQPKGQVTVFDELSGLINSTTIHLHQGMLPSRIVLYRDGEKFVTHHECLRIEVVPDPDRPDTEEVIRTHHLSFCWGHYFDFNKMSGCTEAQALAAAQEDFKERAQSFR